MSFTTLAGNVVDCILLGCVSEKAPLATGQRLPLRDLYTSDLWTKRRAYAEHHEALGCPWLIVSAFHGIRLPGYESGAYDRKIGDYGGKADRAAWSGMAAYNFRGLLPGAPDRQLVVEIHAGVEYRDSLSGPLMDQGVTLVNPLAGLPGIGAQKHRYLELMANVRLLSLFGDAS